jgi:uncharacterized membrane protein
MICQKCGHENTPEARYCAACGASLVPLITPGVGSAYSSAWQKLWKQFPVLVAGLLVSIIVAVGFIFLIVPGIIFACKLAFTPYLVMDRKMPAIDAIKESWRMTGGHSGTVFLIMLLAIPICFAGFLCLGVGIIPATMWIMLTIASLYHSVSQLNKASPQPGVPSA